MLTREALHVSEQVVYEQIGEETLLLQFETGAYFWLNTIGSRMWELLVATGDPEVIVERIHDEFDVTREILRQDLANLIAELKAKELICVSSNNEQFFE